MERSINTIDHIPDLIFNSIYRINDNVCSQDNILKDLIKFNLETNINFRAESCKNDDINSGRFKKIIGQSETINDDIQFWKDLWIQYYTNGSISEIKDKIFSKGFNRFILLRLLLNAPPYLVLESGDAFHYPNLDNDDNYNCQTSNNKSIIKNLDHFRQNDINKYYFIISVLIIKLQIFSDANHRTADKYYNLKTSKTLQNYNQLIDNYINYDYALLDNPSTLDEVIFEIEEFYNKHIESSGGLRNYIYNKSHKLKKSHKSHKLHKLKKLHKSHKSHKLKKSNKSHKLKKSHKKYKYKKIYKLLSNF